MGTSEMHDSRGAISNTAKICLDNLFLINSAADCIIALRTLKKIVITRKSGKILIYGNCVNIFSCVESLLTFHVPGSKIVVIQSPDVCPVRGLAGNEVIEKAVLRSLHHAGVTVHFGYSLIDWTVSMNKTISKVVFCSESESNTLLTFECLALFCYAAKETSTKTYLAIIDSGIVYNGGIIINNEFRTNDEHIFAAGPGTKYSLVYKNYRSDHCLCNSIEIGYQVSQVIRELLEPSDPKHPVSRSTPGEGPRFTWPISTVATLPGGWNFVRISAPGIPLPLECQLQGQGDSGHILTTGYPIDPDGPGYFQLSLSEFNAVTQLVCLSKRDIPHQNLECLYGKHERLLNCLVERYELGLIPDLYSFFSQPWAYALYTTGFDDLVRQCADMFRADEDTGQLVIEHLMNSKQNLLHFDQDAQDEVAEMYEMSSVPLYVQHLTQRYVRERPLELPMYMTDTVMASVHRSYAVSPLHRPSKVTRPSNP